MFEGAGNDPSELAPLYPSLWAELAPVGLAMLGLCGVFCMAAGLVLLAALIVGRV